MYLYPPFASLTACGGNKSNNTLNTGEMQEVDVADLQFPLAEKTTLTGMTQYPANTESDPNKRTIFKRLQEKTNVEIEWKAIQGDQWGEKITLAMADTSTLTDFIFSAGFGDNDLRTITLFANLFFIITLLFSLFTFTFPVPN